MPRMPKYLKREWAFFLDERGRKKYNALYFPRERRCHLPMWTRAASRIVLCMASEAVWNGVLVL